MISDDERREVARRLREYVDLPDDWWADTYSGFYVEKCAFGNVERHRESELFARLADLIEPESERTCRVECYPPGYEDNLHYEVCSECGTILTASRPGDSHAARASYCPSCGARVTEVVRDAD